MPESTRGRGGGAASDMSGIVSAAGGDAPTGLVNLLRRLALESTLAPLGVLTGGVGHGCASRMIGPMIGPMVGRLIGRVIDRFGGMAVGMLAPLPGGVVGGWGTDGVRLIHHQLCGYGRDQDSADASPVKLAYDDPPLLEVDMVADLGQPPE